MVEQQQDAASNSRLPPRVPFVEETKTLPAPVTAVTPTCLDDLPINDLHPQQNTWHLKGGLTVSSEFDSGNLSRCIQAEGDNSHMTCYMNGDGLPYSNVGHYRTWFYFSVQGVKNGDTMTFAIKGMA